MTYMIYIISWGGGGGGAWRIEWNIQCLVRRCGYISWEASHEGSLRIIQSASIVWSNRLQNGHQDNDAFDCDDEKTIGNYVEDDVYEDERNVDDSVNDEEEDSKRQI